MDFFMKAHVFGVATEMYSNEDGEVAVNEDGTPKIYFLLVRKKGEKLWEFPGGQVVFEKELPLGQGESFELWSLCKKIFHHYAIEPLDGFKEPDFDFNMEIGGEKITVHVHKIKVIGTLRPSPGWDGMSWENNPDSKRLTEVARKIIARVKKEEMRKIREQEGDE